MSRMSNFPNGFTQGVTIRGVPLTVAHPGKVFFVNNSSVYASTDDGVAGADTPSAGTYQRPFASIYYAVQQCTASRGDIIFVMPGHAETIADATTLILSTAGVAIVGLGTGSLRPTLTFTAAAANIPITAANVSVHNILHVANFADVASAYTATGTNTPTDFTIEQCEFRDTSSILNFITLVTGNATANSMDGFNLLKNKVHLLGTTASTTVFTPGAAANHVVLSDNIINTPALNDTAALMIGGALVFLDLIVSGNRIFRPSTSSTGGTMISGSGVCTGLVYDNYVWHLDATTGLMISTGMALGFFKNHCPITGAADKSGIVNPAEV